MQQTIRALQQVTKEVSEIDANDVQNALDFSKIVSQMKKNVQIYSPVVQDQLLHEGYR